MSTPLTQAKTQSKPAILIAGPPGTAKTTLAAGIFPNPYIVEIDNNIVGVASYLTEVEKLDISGVSYDVPHIKPDGSLVPRKDRWRTMTKLIEDKINSDKSVQTIVIDSLTGLTEYGFDEVRRQQGMNVVEEPTAVSKSDDQMQIQHWGIFSFLLRHFFIKLRATGKIVVVCAHVKTKEDKLAQFLKQYINVPTTFKEEIAGLFTECWITSVEKSGDRYARFIQTVPGPRQDSIGPKSAMRIGNKVEVDFKKLRTLFA